MPMTLHTLGLDLGTSIFLSLLFIGYGVDRSLIVFSFSLNFRFFNCALVAGRTQHRIPQRRQYLLVSGMLQRPL